MEEITLKNNKFYLGLFLLLTTQVCYAQGGALVRGAAGAARQGVVRGSAAGIAGRTAAAGMVRGAGATGANIVAGNAMGTFIGQPMDWNLPVSNYEIPTVTSVVQNTAANQAASRAGATGGFQIITPADLGLGGAGSGGNGGGGWGGNGGPEEVPFFMNQAKLAKYAAKYGHLITEAKMGGETVFVYRLPQNAALDISGQLSVVTPASHVAVYSPANPSKSLVIPAKNVAEFQLVSSSGSLQQARPSIEEDIFPDANVTMQQGKLVGNMGTSHLPVYGNPVEYASMVHNSGAARLAEGTIEGSPVVLYKAPEAVIQYGRNEVVVGPETDILVVYSGDFSRSFLIKPDELDLIHFKPNASQNIAEEVFVEVEEDLPLFFSQASYAEWVRGQNLPVVADGTIHGEAVVLYNAPAAQVSITTNMHRITSPSEDVLVFYPNNPAKSYIAAKSEVNSPDLVWNVAEDDIFAIVDEAGDFATVAEHGKWLFENKAPIVGEGMLSGESVLLFEISNREAGLYASMKQAVNPAEDVLVYYPKNPAKSYISPKLNLSDHQIKWITDASHRVSAWAPAEEMEGLVNLEQIKVFHNAEDFTRWMLQNHTPLYKVTRRNQEEFWLYSVPQVRLSMLQHGVNLVSLPQAEPLFVYYPETPQKSFLTTKSEFLGLNLVSYNTFVQMFPR